MVISLLSVFPEVTAFLGVAFTFVVDTYCVGGDINDTGQADSSMPDGRTNDDVDEEKEECDDDDDFFVGAVSLKFAGNTNWGSCIWLSKTLTHRTFIASLLEDPSSNEDDNVDENPFAFLSAPIIDANLADEEEEGEALDF